MSEPPPTRKITVEPETAPVKPVRLPEREPEKPAEPRKAPEREPEKVPA